jgi:hypothetical protein
MKINYLCNYKKNIIFTKKKIECIVSIYVIKIAHLIFLIILHL